MNENSSPQPIIEPNDATLVKWTGMAIFVALIPLVGLLYGWFAALLYIIGSFGTLMICVGAESEARRSS